MAGVLEELRELASHAENRPTDTGIPRVVMVKGEIPEHRLSAVYEPMVNLILDGAKTLTVGDQVLRYDPANYFVVGVDMPATGTVHRARGGRPYLAVSLTLTPESVRGLLSDVPHDALETSDRQAFSVCAMTPELLDAWLRMLRLMRSPRDIPALAGVYEREILYRILTGPQGWMLRELTRSHGQLGGVRRAIAHVRSHYQEQLPVARLAKLAGMSESAFHRQFKALTTLSPIQYQKNVRLLQARQLILERAAGVSATAFDVGYESASQFSREYTRMFGVAPSRDEKPR